MALLRRREKPPAAVSALFEGDERAVAWADAAGPDDTTTSVVASTLGLWWPFDDGHRRLPWERIDKVVWRDGWLAATEADVLDDELLVERPAVRVRLTAPRDLPPVVRKRIEANVVKTEVLSVAGGAVRFVARRRPGEDGVIWWARLEPGTRLTDDIRAAVAARLALLRAG
ncbi:hypothetical protein [Jatrophihabitans endophyticus]|uniref:hypothetical protein n=1 Tax=Jatrophihabitans endophyticus TaxID=1206085 RepID=UPI001A02A983|nr:hypothetical protein [Jatrophihabitans endophyticus]MBE7188755.1 hypothetical protein [Jatrophihabitans endophyticus]